MTAGSHVLGVSRSELERIELTHMLTQSHLGLAQLTRSPQHASM
jgi:hypothetical protein